MAEDARKGWRQLAFCSIAMGAVLATGTASHGSHHLVPTRASLQPARAASWMSDVPLRRPLSYSGPGLRRLERPLQPALPLRQSLHRRTFAAPIPAPDPAPPLQNLTAPEAAHPQADRRRAPYRLLGELAVLAGVVALGLAVSTVIAAAVGVGALALMVGFRVVDDRLRRAKDGPEELSAALARQRPSTRRILALLAQHLWPRESPAIRLRVVLAAVLLVASKVFNLQVPFFFKAVVDHLSGKPGGPQPPLGLGAAGLVLAYGGARFATTLLGELRRSVFATVSFTALRRISTQVYSHLYRLDLEFHLNRQTGTLIKTMEMGTRGIGLALSILLFNLFPTGLELVLTTAVLWRQAGPAFAATALLTVAAYGTFTSVVTAWRVRFRIQMNALDAKTTQIATDGLINYETVKYFNNTDLEVQRYDAARQNFAHKAVQVQQSLLLLNVGQSLIFTAALTVLMYLSSVKVAAGLLTVGDLVLVNTLFFQLAGPLNHVGDVYRGISQATTDMENMLRILDEEPRVRDAVHARPLTGFQGGVEFRDVVFRYDPRQPLFRSLSFTAPPGSTVALVGFSGAGKSTVLRLLYRFYDIEGGQILLDGQDLRDLQTESVRRHVAVVSQDPVLFNDTIEYNIKYCAPETSHEEVEAVAKQAALHETILSFPDGYQSIVGERGLKLSGGEKQRLAVARALLKRPRVLVCDEATSSMDSQTEARVAEALRAASRQGITTLIIAHRLSTVMGADKIVVLHEGRVAEEGTHAQLLDRGGLYARFWQRQQRAAAGGAEDWALDWRGEGEAEAEAAVEAEAPRPGAAP
eukprot:EG_transcript_3116